MQVTLIDTMGTDETVVNAARVSFNKEASNYSKEKNEQLIRYLARHKHFSPFGHCFASFRISAPIFVRSQLAKHEYLRINEVSRRYVDYEPEFFIPEEWRLKAEDKKQGSGDSMENQSSLTNAYEAALGSARRLYEDFIMMGMCPEQARMILPQSMMTEWYWSGSMDAFANMCNLRCKPEAQKETRIISDKIDFILSTVWPVSWSSLRESSSRL